MSWWDAILGRTPPYQPQGPTQTGGTVGGTQGGSGWTQYLPQIVGAGAALGSAALQNRSNNQNNARLDARTQMMDQLARDEQARKEYYSSILLPSLLRGMGQKDPGILGMAKSRMQMLPGYGGQPFQQRPPAIPDASGGEVVNAGSGAYGSVNGELRINPRTGLPYTDEDRYE